MGRFRARYLESSVLESERNQIQEVYELAEHDTLRRRVLLAEVVQLFHECLDLGRRTPLVQVNSADDALAGFRVLLKFKGGTLQVNRQRDMADRTCGLEKRVISIYRNTDYEPGPLVRFQPLRIV